MINRICSHCGANWHTAFTCPQKPRKPLKTTKPINKIGRVGKQTKVAVAAWKKTQKPTHEGYFICYICKAWVPYLMAEHVKSKARHSDLRTNPDNFKPSCGPCNEAKGSKDN